jgi:hypothetical protein
MHCGETVRLATRLVERYGSSERGSHATEREPSPEVSPVLAPPFPDRRGRLDADRARRVRRRHRRRRGGLRRWKRRRRRLLRPHPASSSRPVLPVRTTATPAPWTSVTGLVHPRASLLCHGLRGAATPGRAPVAEVHATNLLGALDLRAADARELCVPAAAIPLPARPCATSGDECGLPCCGV